MGGFGESHRWLQGSSSAALVALTSAALAPVMAHADPDHLGVGRRHSAVAFTTTASIAHAGLIYRSRTPAPTECQADAEGADRRTSRSLEGSSGAIGTQRSASATG